LQEHGAGVGGVSHLDLGVLLGVDVGPRGLTHVLHQPAQLRVVGDHKMLPTDPIKLDLEVLVIRSAEAVGLSRLQLVFFPSEVLVDVLEPEHGLPRDVGLVG